MPIYAIMPIFIAFFFGRHLYFHITRGNRHGARYHALRECSRVREQEAEEPGKNTASAMCGRAAQPSMGEANASESNSRLRSN